MPLPVRRTGGTIRGDRGTVTAETAVVLPVLVLVTLGLVWLVSVGVAHVRAVDAARETARAVARGEERSAALALGRRVATPDAHIRVRTGDGIVVVTVVAPVRGPGGIFGEVGGVDARAEAVAALEVVE